MKKLVTKFRNLPFLLIAFLFLLLASCTDDDDPVDEPKNPNPNPNPDGSIDKNQEPQISSLEDSTSIYYIV